MGCRVQINRVIARLSASYLVVFLIVLGAFSTGAYLFFSRSARETLEPLMALPEGQAAYASMMQRVVATIVVVDVPLVVVVGLAAYILARVSVGPLQIAREREERFAADAAHELRTPLATIAAVAQAARASDAATAGRALETITGVALDASRLLADLLALMRDTPDESRLHEPVDLAALVRAMVDDNGSAAGAIRITVDVPPSGAYVLGEERALRQLAGNLIENALRHAHSHVAASVSVDAKQITLSVEDDGAGVRPADRERIFDRFFKADPDAPGSGLGLAIARHIVRRHGGALVLENGSRFTARLPRASD